MNVSLKVLKNKKIKESITISGSKSESNRLLILKELYPQLTIENLSDSDDSVHLQQALYSTETLVNIGHAGTAMRFLTAYFAFKKGREVVLTGSERMQNRPIEILVNALNSLGAEIEFEEKKGYPPIRIKGKEITTDFVAINGNVSSQYISALLLIAPSLPNGLEIKLIGKVTSVPYINMTLSLLRQLNVHATFEENILKVLPLDIMEHKTIVVESDWSSASYFYSVIAFSEIGSEIKLSAYRKESLQGDSCLAEIYNHFGVTTEFQENAIVLRKEKVHKPTKLVLDLKNAPDIAQTISVTCFGLGIACDLSGLHTLKIKETDRLEALQEELSNLGAQINVTSESLHLEISNTIHSNVAIKTYNDHRMAMAFAPLAFKVPIQILDAGVVSKSYQKFWEDMEQIGIQVAHY